MFRRSLVYAYGPAEFLKVLSFTLKCFAVENILTDHTTHGGYK